MLAFARRTRQLSLPLAYLVSVLRLLTVVVTLQFSGAVHFAVDAVGIVVAERAAHEDDCPLDGGPCNDCPPSCPNCHCANAPTAVLPLEVRSLVSPLFGASPTRGLARTEAPPSPELPALFRPPRTLAG